MYYRLTYISTANKQRIGDCVLNGNKPLNIGQGVPCDIELPDSGQYEPQLYVTILFSQEGDGWYVVKRTDCHKVCVNGTEVQIAQTLNHGDVLSLSDGIAETKLKFEVMNDGEYDASSGLVYRKHAGSGSYLVVIACLGILLFGLFGYLFVSRKQVDLKHSDLIGYSASVYRIVTDSVYLECDTVIEGESRRVVVDAIELSDVASGTAFLTEDSLFVTARHCIEPWINDEEWDGVSSKETMSKEVQLATRAETENRQAGYEKYTLRSHCVISKGLDRYDYYSTDFHMNKTRDMVLRVGTEKDVMYWRTIIPLAHRRNMELGDFAYVRSETEKGNISMAGWNEIINLSKPGSDRDIAVVGYPLNDNDAAEVTVVYGNFMPLQMSDPQEEPEGCLQLSASINRGNSGGPVFALIGNKVKAIGIVSKADRSASQGLFWAVPLSEVINMHAQGDSIRNKDISFRR